MSESSFPVAHKRMLVYEGGYSNHPADPGGVTLEGVTQAVYNSWRKSQNKPPKTLTRDMRGTPEWVLERDAIYKSRYWNPPCCGQLEPGVDAAIYDYAVNSGIGRASKVLQRLCGIQADGNIGPVTIQAANRRDAKELVAAICNERLAFLKGLKTWPTFGAGWKRRVGDVKTYATAMAANLPIGSSVPAGHDLASAGKGEVPEPKAVKNATKGAGPAVAAEEAARDGGGWATWIAANPGKAVLVAVVIIVAVGVALHLIERWRQAKQEAPTPGFGVVPERT
jgi:lysozyme family protein